MAKIVIICFSHVLNNCAPNQVLQLTLDSVLPSLPLWSVAVKGS
jgi:hypothetical protein